MEAYEEKSYDLTDHYGSVRREAKKHEQPYKRDQQNNHGDRPYFGKAVLLALLILLLYEAVIRGYAFGHAVFYAEAVEAAPGHDITVVVKDGEDVSQTAGELEKKGLIKNI